MKKQAKQLNKLAKIIFVFGAVLLAIIYAAEKIRYSNLLIEINVYEKLFASFVIYAAVALHLLSKENQPMKKSLRYLKSSFNYIYIVISLFVVSAAFGFIFADELSFLDQTLREIISQTLYLNSYELTAFILMNNAVASLISIIGGIIVGIMPILSSVGNGAIIGYVLERVGVVHAWRLLPHGIFELPAIFISFGLLIWGRFFYLSVIRYEYYLAKAKILSVATSSAAPRGSIFLTDKDSLPFAAALNKEFPLVYAVPAKIKEPKILAEKLAPILELDKETLIQKLSKTGDPYEILKKRVSEEVVKAVKDQNEIGIGIDDETLRYYPEGLYLSHTIGFLGFNKNGQTGQYGLEEYYDKELSGFVSSVDLILTIDSAIQSQAGILLLKTIGDWQADGGSIVVMDPKDGSILAIASSPDFDANNYSSIKNHDFFINPVTWRNT